MSKSTFRRLLAYIIDIIIVAVIASALSSVKIFNPRLEKYGETYDGYMTFIEESLKDTSKLQDLQNSPEYKNYVYEIAYYGLYSSIITVIISFLYFVVFQYFTDGQTGGKKLLGIKIVSQKEDKKLSFGQLTIRACIINSVLINIITIICLVALSKASFTKAQNYIEIVEMAIVFISIGMLLYRKDGRGLHDMIAGTVVYKVSELKEIEEEEKEKQEEAIKVERQISEENFKESKVKGKVKDAEFKEVKKPKKKGNK